MSLRGRMNRRSGPLPRPTIERFLEKIVVGDTPDDCWIWRGAIGQRGYGKILHRGDVRTAHRVSYELYAGPIPDGLWVLHRCDVKACVNPAHLYLGTIVENSRDAKERGQMPRGDRHPMRRNPLLARHGERHHKAKLTDEKAAAIREQVAAGVTQRMVAVMFGVSQPTVNRVANRKGWKHV